MLIPVGLALVVAGLIIGPAPWVLLWGPGAILLICGIHRSMIRELTRPEPLLPERPADSEHESPFDA